MSQTGYKSNSASVPGMVTIKAPSKTSVSPPPGWALAQRELMSAMEEAASLMVEKYTERSGGLYFADCVDDFYERYYNWGLFYAMGANERVFDMALGGWNAITRFCDDGVFHRAKHREYYHGKNLRKWVPQLHNEYFNLATQSGAGSAEWHHLGEANMAFYGFGLADPTISENVRRARRFAAMHMGEDPEAPNYDPVHRLFRSPIQTSEGPCVKGSVDRATWWLQGVQDGKPMGPMTPLGRRATLYPVVKKLDEDWYQDPERRDRIVDLFEKIVLRGDTPQSLAATALITNAYLYTGEEKYRRWVLDYVEGWMDRIRQNNGILPDNVGPTGIIGEHREGQWWGGLYGWSSRGYTNIFHSLIIGAECALLLTGDLGYLDLLRSQVELLLNHSKRRDDGQLVVPTRHGPNGWVDFKPMRPKESAHLYHASMAREDHELIARLREGDVETDWNEIAQEGEKSSGGIERARLQYLDGKNPDWPEEIMQSEYRRVLEALQWMRADSRDAEQMIADNDEPPNPVVTKGLTQMTMGAPQPVYNGGLLRATLRYYDNDQARPGLPPHVAALVDVLEPDRTGVQLVNLSRSTTHTLIVQAGAFGEHQFTEASYQDPRTGSRASVLVEAKCFVVQLPPSTNIRLGIGMRRFANQPSYAFPWHGDKIPVPFQ